MKVVILEDDECQRNLLTCYLASQALEVSAAATVSEFRLLLSKGKEPFDIAIIDLSLPDEFGMNVIQPLRQNATTGIIVLSSHNEQETKLQALQLGADDYVTKPFHLEELLARMRTVVRRLAQSQPWQSRRKLERLLSERELAVLNCIAQGWTGKEIARSMSISPRTIDTYRNRLMEKLQVKNIAELVRVAFRAGLVT